MINTDNYELYFFQYEEGMLSEAERHEVERFMGQHPELAEELELYAEAPVLKAQELNFPEKASLRRTLILPRWRYVAAVSLAIGVAATLMLTLPKSENKDQPIMAQHPMSQTTQVDEKTAVSTSPEATDARPVVQTSLVSRTVGTSIAQPSSLLIADNPESSLKQEPVETDLLANDEVLDAAIEPELMAAIEQYSLAQAEPCQQAQTSYQPQDQNILWLDYSNTPWSELLVEIAMERYPEQMRQFRSNWEKLTSNPKLNKIVKIIQSIV